MQFSRGAVLLCLLAPRATGFRARHHRERKEAKKSAAGSTFHEPEHKKMGDALIFSNGMKGSDKYSLPGYGHNVTLGDILMACGDWYGKKSSPISDVSSFASQKSRFLSGPWHCITSDHRNPARVIQWAGGLGTSFSPPSGCSGYLFLAADNQDHFARFEKYSFSEQKGAGAFEAYTAGHHAACDTAVNGTSEATLKKALMQNACASHYLADLFAAGHLRQVRRSFACTKSVGASGNCLISKMFHDEDNMYGLWVTNANGDKWKAYGDNCWTSAKNAKNRAIALRTLEASSEGIIQAWRSRSTSACKADAIVNRLKVNTRETQDLGAQQRLGNHAPLLIPATGSGCGFPWGPCNGLGSGKVTDNYMRRNSCDMRNSTVRNYNWYKAETSLAKLNTLCKVGGRGSSNGYNTC